MREKNKSCCSGKKRENFQAKMANQMTLGCTEVDGPFPILNSAGLNEWATTTAMPKLQEKKRPECLVLQLYNELEKSFQKSERCYNDSFAQHESRMRSFDRYAGRENNSLIQQLVKNGFYCTALDFSTRCFYCGVYLRNWDSYDDVTIEHLVWSKRMLGAPCPRAIIRFLSAEN